MKITKTKYLVIVISILFFTPSSTILISCPTCIGYPEKNKRPFFEEKEAETTSKVTNNETKADCCLSTVPTAIDSQEDNS